MRVEASTCVTGATMMLGLAKDTPEPPMIALMPLFRKRLPPRTALILAWSRSCSTGRFWMVRDMMKLLGCAGLALG
ncbi:hypothetical protein AWV80_16255 [Cupriavidus sp. UYMU48A]|nr:hypothetical protein AWV80_16255 [Cupriavidus sp. UYMU48A]